MATANDKLKDRLNNLLEFSDKRWDDENMETRIGDLARRYHDGSPGSEEEKQGLVTTVNEVFPRVRTKMAALFAKRPDIIVRARRREFADRAENAELFLNYWTRYKRIARELREWLFSARLFHYGAIQIGMEGTSPSLPFAKALDPRSVRVDPGLEKFRPNEGIWVAKKFKSTVTNLERSGFYDKKALDKAADLVMKRGEDSGAKDLDSAELLLWEQYIRDGKKLLVSTHIASVNGDSIDKNDYVWLRLGEEYTSIAGLPIKFLYFAPSPHTWHPQSPIEVWLPQQKEINEFRTQKLLEAIRGIRKVAYDKTRIRDEDKATLESAEPLTFVPTDGPPAGVFEKIDLGLAPAEPTQGEIDAGNTITQIDGAGGAQLGTEPKRGSSSATRDAIAESNLRLRASDDQEIWEDALEEFYQDIYNLAQGHMKGELWVHITGAFDKVLTREEITADADVILSFGSTIAKDRGKERAEALLFYDKFRMDPLFDPMKVCRYVLARWGDIKNPEDMLVPPAPQPPIIGPGVGMPMMPGMGGGMPRPQAGGAPQMALNQMARGQIGGGMPPLSRAAQQRKLVQ